MVVLLSIRIHSNNSLDTIGIIVNSEDTATQTVDSSTLKKVASVTLEKGSYILSSRVSFSKNANGYRAIAIGIDGLNATDVVKSGVTCNPNGSNNDTLREVTIINATSQTTYYLYAYHNCESSLTCTQIGLSAMRVK